MLQGKLRSDRSVAFYDSFKRVAASTATAGAVSAAAGGILGAAKAGGATEGETAAVKDLEGDAAQWKYTTATATVVGHSTAPGLGLEPSSAVASVGAGSAVSAVSESTAAAAAAVVLRAGERGHITLFNKYAHGYVSVCCNPCSVLASRRYSTVLKNCFWLFVVGS